MLLICRKQTWSFGYPAQIPLPAHGNTNRLAISEHKVGAANYFCVRYQGFVPIAAPVHEWLFLPFILLICPFLHYVRVCSIFIAKKYTARHLLLLWFYEVTAISVRDLLFHSLSFSDCFIGKHIVTGFADKLPFGQLLSMYAWGIYTLENFKLLFLF